MYYGDFCYYLQEKRKARGKFVHFGQEYLYTGFFIKYLPVWSLLLFKMLLIGPKLTRNPTETKQRGNRILSARAKPSREGEARATSRRRQDAIPERKRGKKIVKTSDSISSILILWWSSSSSILVQWWSSSSSILVQWSSHPLTQSHQTPDPMMILNLIYPGPMILSSSDSILSILILWWSSSSSILIRTPDLTNPDVLISLFLRSFVFRHFFLSS